MAAAESPGATHVRAAVAERVRHQDPADKRVFDRLTRLVSTLLEAPVSLLLIADDERLLFASFVGPDDPWSTLTEFPRQDAYCQFAIGSRAPFVIEDARLSPLVCDLPPTVALDVVAYLGVPLLTAANEPIGILCAIDFEPRAWTEQQVLVVQDLAATVMAYLEARREPQRLGSGLNIAAVSQRTGIGADTLRKWERRYGVLRPGRTAGGQRRYDETDVARVVWLRDRLAQGFRIGEAAALLDAGATRPTASTTDLRDAIVTAAAALNTLELTGLVEQAFVLHDVATAVEDVIGPALQTVGDAWQTDPGSIAGEHLLSQVALARLRTLLDYRRPALNGTVVLACGPGERHELGLLALAVTLQADGWLAVYLGADTPLRIALATAARTDAGVLCLGVNDTHAFATLESDLADEEIPDGLVVVTGGAARREASGLAATVARLREAAATPPV
ncbi:MAG: MerR family transcriptional regulator [Gaiellaceae bacterium]